MKPPPPEVEACFDKPDIFRDIFENATIGIFQTTPQGRYIRVNPALAEMYGYDTPDDMLSALTDITLQLYVDPTRREAFRTALSEQGKIDTFESQVYRRDGTVIWISESARVVRPQATDAQHGPEHGPEHDPEHHPEQEVYYEGFVKDITKSKNLEAEVTAFTQHLESRVKKRTHELTLENERRRLAQNQLKEALGKAEDAIEAKSRFLANMSHELRTPLNAIIGFAQAIQSEMYGPIQPTAYGEYVGIVETSAQHLLDLINDILDLSKIDSGTVELSLEVLDVADLMDDCLSLLIHRAEDAEVTLVRNFGASPSTIRGDARRLKQVLLNLLSNAIKFTPAGGKVTAQIEPVGAGGLTITITDTGVGIAAEDIPKVQSEYGQAEHGLDHLIEGTGLGLPISKKLVQLHGGQLTLDSAPGEGTTVTVVLPN